MASKTRDAKDQGQADMKAMTVFNRWLYIDGAEIAGRFADPRKSKMLKKAART